MKQYIREVVMFMLFGYLLGNSIFFGMVFSGKWEFWGIVAGAVAQLFAIAVIVIVVKTSNQRD